MTALNLKLKKLTTEDDIPFFLLLLADETTDAIEKYIYQCDVYIVHRDNSKLPIAVFALQTNSENELEIKNMAIVESYQRIGIGKIVISEIKKIAKKENFKHIIVGTPDVAIPQITFYENNGFIKSGMRKNFFVENYSKPIVENGAELKDMQLLKYLIHESRSTKLS